MKQNVSLLLALMLVVCVIVLPVCAEEVEEPTQTTEAVESATEVGDGTGLDSDGVVADTELTEDVLLEDEMDSVVVFGGGDLQEAEMEDVKVVGDEERQEVEMEDVKTYGEEEEEGGFWAWLVSLWEVILAFFGL